MDLSFRTLTPPRLATLLCLTAAMAWGQPETPHRIDAQALDERLTLVAGLSRGEYAVGRAELERLYEDSRALFGQFEMTSGSWEVRLLAGIIRERVAKIDEVRALLDAKPETTNENVQYRRIRERAAWLAEQGKGLPFLLAERVWKGNEIAFWRNSTEEDAIVIRALGILKAVESRPVLESLLTREPGSTPKATVREQLEEQRRQFVNDEAIMALAVFRDGRSVAPLIRELKRADGISIRTVRLAADALGCCADTNTIPLLQRERLSSASKRVRAALDQVIEHVSGARNALSGMPAGGETTPMHLKTPAQRKVYLEGNPTDWRAWLDMALLQIEAGESAEAADSLRRAVKAGHEEAQAAIEKDPRLRALLPAE